MPKNVIIYIKRLKNQSAGGFEPYPSTGYFLFSKVKLHLQ